MATGLSPDSLNPSPEWQKDLLPNRPFRLPTFAPVGIAIQCISYEIIAEVLKRKADATLPEARQIMTDARRWIDRAHVIGLDKIAPAKEIANFEAWLKTLAELNDRDREPPPLVDRQARQQWFNEWPLASKLRCAMPQIFAQALTDSIAFLAGSPASAALVPAEAYDSMERRFSPLARPKLRTHQMLGHAPATQEAMGVDSDLICLLQLVSEEALGMTFGDAGEVAFWISGDDLTRGRFDNAKIRLQGH